MRLNVLLVTAILALPASAASARGGCGYGYGNNRLGSENFSSGINAVAPSRATQNPCSSMYGFGKNLRKMEKRRYPGAIVRH